MRVAERGAERPPGSEEADPEGAGGYPEGGGSLAGREAVVTGSTARGSKR